MVLARVNQLIVCVMSPLRGSHGQGQLKFRFWACTYYIEVKLEALRTLESDTRERHKRATLERAVKLERTLHSTHIGAYPRLLDVSM